MKSLSSIALLLCLSGAGAVAAPEAGNAAGAGAVAKPAATKSGKSSGASKSGKAAPAPQPAVTAKEPENYLPDSALLGRVEDRLIRVIDFRDRFFASRADVRPRTDSAGREEFLERMIDKEVLGLTAREANPPLTFDDRLKLREHTNTVLENVLYLRRVLDRVKITEEDIRAVYPQYGYELRLRAILFSERATAEKVRLDLLRGRIGWGEAVRRYSKAQAGPDGDLGWVQRAKLRSVLGLKAFALQPGAMSEVIMDVEGFRVFQCVERRKVPMPPESFRHALTLEDLRAAGRAPFVEEMYREVRELAHVEYDTTNILWAAGKFKEAYAAEDRARSGIDMTGVMPEFAPQDTNRVLVRTKDRKITVGQFAFEFASVPAMFRQRIVSLEPFIFALDGPAMRGERIQLAYARGIDKDPESITLIERLREELMVEHLYQDSVLNLITVSPEMRRRYYKDREHEFVSNPRVRYARFLRMNQEEADALITRLKAGERAESITEADSLRGDDTTGTIQEVWQPEAAEVRKLLFEELKPGQTAKVGPDQEGKFLVFQSLRYDPVRKMAYEEVQNIIDESLQNIEAQRIITELLERRRKRYRVEAHPELLGQIRLTDPKLDVALGDTARQR